MKQSLFSVALIALLLSLFGVAQLGASPLATNGQTALQANPPAGPRYAITDLGTLGGSSSGAYGINDEGQVVGWSATSGGNTHAFLWEDGVMTDLGTLGGQMSRANDINDAGQIVGMALTSSGGGRPFLWQNGDMQDLGTFGGNSGEAYGVNSSGQVAGWSLNSTQQMRAFLWQNGSMQDLGTLGGNSSLATDINDAGQVVGHSERVHREPFYAFLWQGGSMQDLGTLGGPNSQAYAINNAVQVVGESFINGDTQRPFLWQNGGMQDLGTLGGQIFNVALDINDQGQVVGHSYILTPAGRLRAFLWENGQMQDLNNLIPPGSGWELTKAHAINSKGQIVGEGNFNGQGRAFLLKPQAYRWINASGGSWHVTTNWDPQGDPGDGDTVVFALSGQYTVDASAAFTAATPAATFPVRRAIISGTNTVDFVNLSLNLLDDSVTEPALTVNDGGTVKITSGAGNMIHAIIGGDPPTNPSIAHLQVFNSGTSLNGTGRLSIGDEGAGDLFVANGGHLTSAEARLGGLLPTAPGTAVVGGDGSLWDTGNIAVGYGALGTLTIESGGRVNSNDAFVSFGIISGDSNVTIEGVGAGTSQASLWALLGNLTIGQTGFGYIEVLNGGDLYVSQNVQIKNGELRIDGRHSNGDPSDLDVLGSVFVGGAGSANLLAFWNAAKGDIDGDLIIGKEGVGAAILWGTAVTSNPTFLEVVDPQAGLCAIGREFDGGVSLDEGGLLRCRNIEIGGQAGTNGTGSLTVDGGFVRALEILQVGQVGGGSGQLDMQNDALVATDGTYITPNGVIAGTGTLAVGFFGLVNQGTLSPNISVSTPSRLQGATQSTVAAPGGLRTLNIDGDLELLPGGVLILEHHGPNPGEFDVLHITGQTSLGGRLEVHFRGGFSPDDPTAFIQSQDFVESEGIVTGDYDQRIYAFPDIFADFDDDGDKDLADVAAFQNCFGLSGGELEPACSRADWEDNGVLNEVEVRELTARLSGPR